MLRRPALAMVLLALAVTACAQGGAATDRPAGASSTSAAPQKILVYISRGEPPTLAVKPLVGFSGSLNPQLRLFNAMLDYIDESEAVHPYLTESLPQLNTDAWRVSPDGSMETTYRLRPNLTWHDGTPFSADDFAFGWQVYAKPELGVASSLPISVMQEVIAPDPRTVVIRWKQPFPDAASMDNRFQALPRHLLEGSFHDLDSVGFINQSFWTYDYVGMGAYRVEHWEPGAFIEATAFDAFALGKPKIDRLKVLFVGNANTALASILSGEADFVSDFVLDIPEAEALEQQWAARADGGTVYYAPVLIRLSQIQRRPAYAQPQALLDVRVRRALAHAFDTPGVIDGLTAGRGVLTYTLTSPRVSYYPVIERAISKYEYDPKAAQRLLEEAGMVRGSAGLYTSPGGEPFEVKVWTTGGAYERENRVWVDGLRRVGIDAVPQTLGPALLNDPETRALSPGLFTGGAPSGPERYRDFSINSIPKPQNRWQGSNRGGWESPDYERFYQAYNTTLDPDQRAQHLAQMEKALTDDVGTIPHYFTLVVTAFSASLKGPLMRQTPDAVTGQSNLYAWEWKS